MASRKPSPKMSPRQKTVHFIQQDRMHRGYGASLIQALCGGRPPKFPARVMVTACHLLQTFHCYCSYKNHDIRFTAAAAILLATKSEELRTPLAGIVKVGHHILAMRFSHRRFLDHFCFYCSGTRSRRQGQVGTAGDERPVFLRKEDSDTRQVLC